jgi:hypothetical protein
MTMGHNIKKTLKILQTNCSSHVVGLCHSITVGFLRTERNSEIITSMCWNSIEIRDYTFFAFCPIAFLVFDVRLKEISLNTTVAKDRFVLARHRASGVLKEGCGAEASTPFLD